MFNHHVLQNLVWIAFPYPGWDQKKIFIAALRKKTVQLACWPESESHRVAGLI